MGCLLRTKPVSNPPASNVLTRWVIVKLLRQPFMLARETVLSGNGALSSLVLRLLHLVLSYNHNTPDVMTGIRCVSREVARKKILSYRAMGLLCRQQAVLRPETSWKWLSEAERWEHLAHVEIASHFRECNTTSLSDLAKSGAPSDTRWETDAAA